MAEQLNELLQSVQARYAELPAGSEARRDFLAHLRSLARWHAEPTDYPEAGTAEFPAHVRVALAICHPECGAREFIVDGSTQGVSLVGGSSFVRRRASTSWCGSRTPQARAAAPPNPLMQPTNAE